MVCGALTSNVKPATCPAVQLCTLAALLEAWVPQAASIADPARCACGEVMKPWAEAVVMRPVAAAKIEDDLDE